MHTGSLIMFPKVVSVSGQMAPASATRAPGPSGGSLCAQLENTSLTTEILQTSGTHDSLRDKMSTVSMT